MDFEFDLFGTGKKKDDSLQGRIKEWVRAHYKVPEEIPVIVVEVYCDLPGCAPIETHIAILDPAGRRQYKLGRPMKEIYKEDMPHLQPNPDGHGPRIDIDTLGTGSSS